MEYNPTNREKSRTSNKQKWYCYCDGDMVGDLGRCGYCGRIFNKKKKK